MELDTQLKTTEVELHTISWLKDQDRTKLEAEKKTLDDRFKALESFESSRVDWSTQLRTISTHIPASTLVTSFQGNGELNDKGPGNSSNKNQMVVNFTTPLGEDGDVPPEVNEFIAKLRVEPAMKKTFPMIDVSGVQARAGQGGQNPIAVYSVVCKPGATPKTEPVKAGASTKH